MQDTTESLSKTLKKEIIIIVAYLENTLGIGFNGGLPWPKIIADMIRFVKETMGQTVIMGRKTWESIGSEALDGRQNIVVSTTLKPEDLGKRALLARSLTDAIHMANRKKIFILGGEPLFKEAMDANIATTIIATIVHEKFECDRFFPTIPDHWESVEQGDMNIDFKSKLRIRFIKLNNTLNSFSPVEK